MKHDIPPAIPIRESWATAMRDLREMAPICDALWKCAADADRWAEAKEWYRRRDAVAHALRVLDLGCPVVGPRGVMLDRVADWRQIVGENGKIPNLPEENIQRHAAEVAALTAEIERLRAIVESR